MCGKQLNDLIGKGQEKEKVTSLRPRIKNPDQKNLVSLIHSQHMTETIMLLCCATTSVRSPVQNSNRRSVRSDGETMAGA